ARRGGGGGRCGLLVTLPLGTSGGEGRGGPPLPQPPCPRAQRRGQRDQPYPPDGGRSAQRPAPSPSTRWPRRPARSPPVPPPARSEQPPPTTRPRRATGERPSLPPAPPAPTSAAG